MQFCTLYQFIYLDGNIDLDIDIDIFGQGLDIFRVIITQIPVRFGSESKFLVVFSSLDIIAFTSFGELSSCFSAFCDEIEQGRWFLATPILADEARIAC